MLFKMASARHLSQARLRELLSYEPATGIFRWRVERRGSGYRRGEQPAGSIAGHLDVKGYSRIFIDGYRYKAHRLAWLYMMGVWPVGDIDHKNQNRADNSWENLRVANRAQNRINSAVSKNNSSGFRGAHTARNGWTASIGHRGRRQHLGTFATPEDAQAAYVAAARKLYGEFAEAL